MILNKHVSQPFQRKRYVSLALEALARARFVQVRAAFAYATDAGVNELESVFAESCGDAWEKMRKRWLIGIDWCRTEPCALDRLCQLSASEVRIPFGREVVRRRGCTPAVPFHPKVLILQGTRVLAVISGSGNLSRNGMIRGHECGSVVLVSDPKTAFEKTVWKDLNRVRQWFDRLWRTAVPIKGLRTPYLRVYDSAETLKAAAATDDDAAETGDLRIATKGRRRSLDPRRLRQLRAARCLWIEAGNLHANRGEGRPGNQLMMSPFTRVFFGYPARDLSPDSRVGDVTIRFKNRTRDDCSIRFSNNSMDVLTLPVPDAGGPPRYDRTVLLFAKHPHRKFVLSLGSRVQAQEWRRLSGAKDACYAMTSGRRWGVF